MNTPSSDGAPRVFWSLGLLPVQSWIAEARRSRDLWVGSRLLALLMGDLLSRLNARGAILLPDVSEDDLSSLQGDLQQVLERGTTAVSNRASGTLPGTPEAGRALLASLDEALRERWGRLVTEIRTSAGRSARDLWHHVGPEIDRPECPPECPFDLVWAVQEVAGSDEDGLRRIDRLYAAVKRSRPIRPHRGGANVRKCGQCGRRESLGGPDPKTWRRFQQKLAGLSEVQRGLRIEADEYLCPICALRRFAGYVREEAFPSTSALAARDWQWKVETSADLKACLEAHRDAAKRVPGYQESWADRAPLLYRTTLDRELRDARRYADSDRIAALERVSATLGELGKAIVKHNRVPEADQISTTPPDYLAVIHFDGDDLGRLLRRHLAWLPGRVREFQNALAARVGASYEGLRSAEAFYLGGDEGLLLAPAGSALAVAAEIRKLWDEVMAEGREGEELGKPPTLSASIAVFHRERPLGAAVEEARRALETAKAMQGKNALVVSVQTASGSTWSAAGRWEEEWKPMATAVDLIRNRRLAAGWPYDVEAFLRSLPDAAFQEEELRRAVREEVRRLTDRRTLDRGEEAPREGETPKDPWTSLRGDAWWKSEPPPEILASLPERFHVVAFLARQAAVGEAG